MRFEVNPIVRDIRNRDQILRAGKPLESLQGMIPSNSSSSSAITNCMAHWGGLFTSSTGSYGTNFDRTGAPTWLWMAFTGASCSATYATRPPEKLCEFSASLLNWYDRQTYELNVTSLALGIVIAIFVVVVLGGIAHEFASRIRRRRHIEAEIDRDILYWPTTTPVTPRAEF
jgi:hypothetical protein